MKLQNELVKMFKEDLKAVFDKEQKEDGYLPQEDFKCCYDRAEAGVYDATVRVKSVLALAIAKHREEEHSEDTSTEQADLSEGMGDEELHASAAGSWGN
jgi:hypothetical protein